MTRKEMEEEEKIKAKAKLEKKENNILKAQSAH